MRYTQSDIDNIITSVEKFYDEVHPTLGYDSQGNKLDGGVIRINTEQFVENVLQIIFDKINELYSSNIQSIVGGKRKVKRTINYNGTEVVDEVQVDRHVMFNDKFKFFVENKTYLDKCFMDRAYNDFRRIIRCLKQDNSTNLNEVRFFIFAGQTCVANDSAIMLESDFMEDMTNLCPDVNPIALKPIPIFFLKGKRSHHKALYKHKYDLDKDALTTFIKMIIDSL